MTSDSPQVGGGWGYPPFEKVVRRGCWVTNPFIKGAHTGKERTAWNVYIEDLIKKIDCWHFWGYCLVASYQYYRICAIFMIKRQRWADVHRHLRRLFPEGESTTPQEVLERLRSRRGALRKIETWMTLHMELLFFFRQGRALVRGQVSAPFLLSAKKARQRMKTKENRWGRTHQELRQIFCRTPPHTAPAVLRRIHHYKTWELHRGSWDPLMVKLPCQDTVIDFFFIRCTQIQNYLFTRQGEIY